MKEENVGRIFSQSDTCYKVVAMFAGKMQTVFECYEPRECLRYCKRENITPRFGAGFYLIYWGYDYRTLTTRWVVFDTDKESHNPTKLMFASYDIEKCKAWCRRFRHIYVVAPEGYHEGDAYNPYAC